MVIKYTDAYNRLFSSQVMVRRDEALDKADFRACMGASFIVAVSFLQFSPKDVHHEL